MTKEEFVYGGHTHLGIALQEKYDTIWRWSTGEYRKIKLQRLQEIAAKVGVDIETLSDWLEARYRHYQNRSEIRTRLQEGAS
jgi:hypothetical protein